MAFYGTALSNFLQDIPHGFYLVADSTYTLSSSYWFHVQAVTRKGKIMM
jgi:hypothetical protein